MSHNHVCKILGARAVWFTGAVSPAIPGGWAVPDHITRPGIGGLHAEDGTHVQRFRDPSTSRKSGRTEQRAGQCKCLRVENLVIVQSLKRKIFVQRCVLVTYWEISDARCLILFATLFTVWISDVAVLPQLWRPGVAANEECLTAGGLAEACGGWETEHVAGSGGCTRPVYSSGGEQGESTEAAYSQHAGQGTGEKGDRSRLAGKKSTIRPQWVWTFSHEL